MKNIVLGASLLLAACGGGGEQAAGGGNQPPTKPVDPPPLTSAYPGYDLPRTIAALKKHVPLPPYPLGTPTFIDPPVDANGIIVDARTGTINPTLAARYALYEYHVWTKQPTNEVDQKLIDTALKQTDWLAANIDCSSKNSGIWKHDFAASFDAQPGWGGGFTNAHGAIALIIMSRFISKPERYLEPAFCALNAFDLDTSAGGLRTVAGSGYFYEEYSTYMRSGVLNGHVFALAGLYYACTYGEIVKACRMFDKGYEGLKHQLPRYDAGVVSKYSLVEGNFASPGYNELNGAVLKWLNSVRPDPVLQKYIALFEDYAPEKFSVSVSSYSGDGHTAYHLTDGNLWHNYWESYQIPASIEFDMGSPQYVKSLAISFVGEATAEFEYSIDGGSWFRAPVATIAARHTVAEHRSTVGIYSIATTGQKVKIRFNQPTIGNVIALREINVIH